MPFVTFSSVGANDFLYTDWELVLKASVLDGYIDMSALKENEHYLYAFLHDVKTLDAKTLRSWPHNQKLAFWINVYNACSLSLLLKNPYATNIAEIREKPSDQIFYVCGEKLSLNNMKHTYLRGYGHDERVHFAIVSPAKGFPRLRNEAYLLSNVNLLLEEDVKRFLLRKDNYFYDADRKELYLSQLFRWYGKDFIKGYENDKRSLQKFSEEERAIINFLSIYNVADKEMLLAGNYTIVWIQFDWNLNTIK